MITQELVKSLFNYNPETGIFTRIKKTAQCTKIGDIVGTKDSYGYLQTKINSRLYLLHRVAWLYVYGEWPGSQIDHKNNNKSDNRIDNLRLIDNTHNCQNKRNCNKNNKTGFLGASKHGKKYRATISIYGNHYRLGVYDTPEAAHNVYMQWKLKYHPGFIP